MATLLGTAGTTTLSAIQAFVLMPLCLKYLGPETYGAWLASGDILVWLQSSDLGLPNLMIQRMAVAFAKDQKQVATDYFVAGVFVLGVLAVVFTSALVVLAPSLAVTLLGSTMEAQAIGRAVRLGALASGATLANWAIVALSRSLQRTAFLSGVSLCATAVGFAATAYLLYAGFGLVSIPAGMIARTSVLIVGSAVFLLQGVQSGALGLPRLRVPIVKEFLALSPATAGGSLAYAVMNQSDNAVVGLTLGPSIVPIYAATKKVADALRGVLDMVAFSSYAGFAHIVGQGQREKVTAVFEEVRSLAMNAALVGCATYIAFNRSFVSCWVGAAFYGGGGVTILLGLQTFLGAMAFLVNYLYRATGAVTRGSLALVLECAVRVPLAIGLAQVLGMSGLPLAALLTSLPALAIVSGWMRREGIGVQSGFPRRSILHSVLRSAACALTLVLCFGYDAKDWVQLGTTVGGFLVAVSAQVIATDPSVKRATEHLLAGAAQRLRHARQR